MGLAGDNKHSPCHPIPDRFYLFPASFNSMGLQLCRHKLTRLFLACLPIPFGRNEGNAEQQHSEDLRIEEGGDCSPLQTHRVANSFPPGRCEPVPDGAQNEQVS